MSDSKFLLASQLAPIHFALQESDNAPTPDKLAEIGTASRQFTTFCHFFKSNYERTPRVINSKKALFDGNETD